MHAGIAASPMHAAGALALSSVALYSVASAAAYRKISRINMLSVVRFKTESSGTLRSAVQHFQLVPVSISILAALGHTLSH